MTAFLIIKIKKQLNLAIELEFFENYYNQGIIVNFKIGEEKLYNLNHKFSELIRNYGQEDYQIVFGKNFTYDSNKHFFSKSDENIIKYFVDKTTGKTERNNPADPGQADYRPVRDT